LKGLPSAYDKDLQEDKLPLFNAYDTLQALLPVLAGALRSMTVHPERMQARIGADLMATDLADYLVDRGMPFRQAHALVGNAVQLAASQGKSLGMLTLEDYRSLSAEFGTDVLEVFDSKRSINRRAAYGGTAPEAMREQLRLAREVLTPDG
jgi:argininosuccinate lyase